MGKTIGAGLLLSQKWTERKRQLLVIVPANLRKQWSQEGMKLGVAMIRPYMKLTGKKKIYWIKSAVG